MWVPLKKKRIQNDSGVWKKENQRGRGFNIFFSFIRFSEIYGNLTIGFRREKHKKCSTRRGLRVGTKTLDFTKNSGKNSEKIQIFSFSRIYSILVVRIFVPRIKVTLRDESYAWVPKSRDFAGFPHEIVNSINTYKIVNTYEYA